MFSAITSHGKFDDKHYIMKTSCGHKPRWGGDVLISEKVTVMNYPVETVPG